MYFICILYKNTFLIIYDYKKETLFSRNGILGARR